MTQYPLNDSIEMICLPLGFGNPREVAGEIRVNG